MGKLSLLCWLLLSLHVHAKPDVQITRALDALLIDVSQLQDHTIADYKTLIKKHISPNIDTLNMAQLILGRNWKRASIEQKQRFLECFSRQLLSNQAQAFLEWQPTSWSLKAQTFNDNDTKSALVMSLNQSQASREFTLRLHRADGRWLIYDASYLGISLLKNFKDDYAVKISSQGLNKTLAQLCKTYPKIIKELTLAGTQWPPFIARSLPGQGLSVEIVSAVLSQAGYQVSTVFVPWKRVIKGLRQGEYDVSLALWKSPRRQAHLLFSDPYFINELVGVQHKDSKLSVVSLDDALSKNVSLGLMDDYAYSEQIQQYPDRRYFTQYTPLLRELGAKSLDLSLLDKSVARFYLERSGSFKKSLQVTTITLESKPLHIGIAKQHPAAKEVISNFNLYLKTYLKSDDYRALLSRYNIK